tara:strand:- start:3032 stop:3250 length:219 start_codon:yes stop_codon:yes gene_type:complete
MRFFASRKVFSDIRLKSECESASKQKNQQLISVFNTILSFVSRVSFVLRMSLSIKTVFLLKTGFWDISYPAT